MTDQLPATITETEERGVRIRDSAVAWDRNAGRLVPQTLGEVVQFAEAMSRGGIALRKHLRGNTGTCLAVCIQAAEWQMSAFALANKSYSVNDQLAYEASVFAAVIIKFAPIKGRPKYRFEGEGDKRVCIASVMADDGDGGWELLEQRSPEFSKITPKNSPLWKIDPDQQQSYYTIRAMSRLHFPDITMGALDVDEAASIREEPQTSGVASRLTGRGDTGLTEATMAEIEVHAAAVRGKRAPEPDAAIEAIAEAEPEIVEQARQDQAEAAEGAEAMAAPMEADPDDWKVLENHEGPAPTGIVYLLVGDQISPAGRLPTYQDGEPFSNVGQKGAAQLPQYTEHPTPEQLAPAHVEEDQDDAPSIRSTPEDRVEPESDFPGDRPPPSAPQEPEGGFLADMRAADSWLVIKRQTGDLSQTPVWKAATEELRDVMRCAIVGVVDELKAHKPEEPVAPTNDPTFFRLWLATQSGANAELIETTLRNLKKSAGWGKLTEANQQTLVALASAQSQKGGA